MHLISQEMAPGESEMDTTQLWLASTNTYSSVFSIVKWQDHPLQGNGNNTKC